MNKIISIMKPVHELIAISPYSTYREAANLMAKNELDSIPIFEKGIVDNYTHFLGIIKWLDIMKNRNLDVNINLCDVKIKYDTIAPQDFLIDIASGLEKEYAYFVVNDQNMIIGLVNPYDIFRTTLKPLAIAIQRVILIEKILTCILRVNGIQTDSLECWNDRICALKSIKTNSVKKFNNEIIQNLLKLRESRNCVIHGSDNENEIERAILYIEQVWPKFKKAFYYHIKNVKISDL